MVSDAYGECVSTLGVELFTRCMADLRIGFGSIGSSSPIEASALDESYIEIPHMAADRIFKQVRIVLCSARELID